MADQPTSPKRRRRKVKPAEQAIRPVVVNDQTQEPTHDNENGVSMSEEMVEFFARNPLMERRRLHFTSQELIHLLGQALIQRGMPADKLNHTRWLWVGGKNGCPELFLIMPGIDA